MPNIISKITVNNVEYELKDAQAREDIAALESAIAGGVTFMGETTTALTDGSTVSTIVIGGSNVNAIKGYLVVSNSKEFVYDGAKWIELGDLSLIGDLGWKDSASGTYTPVGTVSQPTFSGTELNSTGNFTPAGNVTISKGNGTANYTPEGTVAAPSISLKTAGATTNVNSITDVGTLPSFSATVANENLTLSFDAGSLPTKGANQSVKTGDGEYEASAPAFTGTGAELKGIFAGTQGSVSVKGTPAGTVSQPTFSGTQATVTVS